MNPKKTDKEIIILRHIGGRFGNQLWLYSNVYAYCLEKGYKCTNPSFYAYNKHFGFTSYDPIINILGYISGSRINNTHAMNYLIYTLYKFYSFFIPLFRRGLVVKTGSNEQIKNLSSAIETTRYRRIYIDCMELSNIAGVKKYRKQIIKKFSPKKDVVKKVNSFLGKFKNYYLVAVHIRQGDYKRFRGGKLYFELPEIASCLKNFLSTNYKGKKKVKFVLFSDSGINLKYFKGLNVIKGFGPDYTVEDMLTMSKCDIIIASESSFSSFAAYFGGKPLLNFVRSSYDKIDIKNATLL